MDERRKNPYLRAGEPPQRSATGRPHDCAPDPPRGGSRTGAPQSRTGLRELPRDLQDLADGKIDRLRRARTPSSALDDPREGAVIAGVRNADARAVYDARVSALRAALASSDEAALDAGLREVRQLGLWRARNVTDCRAFAESVVGVPPDMLDRVLPNTTDPAAERLAEPVVALVIRTEAALLSRGVRSARVWIEQADSGARLSLSLPLGEPARTIDGLADVGRAAAGLARFLQPSAAYGPGHGGAPERRASEHRGPEGGPNRRAFQGPKPPRRFSKRREP